MMALVRSFDARALRHALGAPLLLGAAIAAGSRGFRDYDLALLPYTFGVLFSSFAVAYRYAVWLQRPATRVYWTHGWGLLRRRGDFVRNLLFLTRATGDGLFAQRFIKRRSSSRWIAHFCFAWGCVIAGAVTFPLVFGWLHFETRVLDPHWYRVVLFGLTLHEFHTESLTRYVLFNLLNLSAVLVIVGVSLALHRRLSDGEAKARQQFGNDIIPLILLLAISGTGLLLTFSMHALRGYGYPVISLVHALVVTGTLLYLPFGKFFHIFQRPAQLSVSFYKRASAASPPALCAACGDAYAGSLHVQDLKQVLHEVGMDWTLAGRARHFADICPRCRRRLLGFSHARHLER